MRIAQVAPLYESVPPRQYGGTERVVSYLTEELVQMGHDVTLFASRDSVTRAKLRPICDQALRLDPECVDPLAEHVYMGERVFQESDQFEIVHAHIDYLGFPFWRRMRIPHLTTLHGRLDIPHLQNLYREFKDEPVVSISLAQRSPIPVACWAANVFHGLPLGAYQLREKAGQYLAFIGRVSPEKRVDLAIEIARRAELPLKIAAKVDRADREYFEAKIKPLLNATGIEFIGEIAESDKNEFLGDALALLFPIDWPEPFGLVMIEAMACGTPVIATRRGSVPEVIDHGVSGFIVDGTDQAVQALERLGELDRRRIRQRFEERFSVSRMAKDYVDVYQQLIRSEVQCARHERIR